MNLLTALMLLNFADVPQVEIETVSGAKTSGQIVSVDATGWTLRTAEKEVKLESRSVLSMSLKSGAAAVEKRGQINIAFVDGANLAASTVVITGKEAVLESSIVGKMTIARKAVSSIRLAGSPTLVDQSWQDLLNRKKNQDMLVVQKGEVLDFYEGVIGDVTDQTVNLLLDNDNVPVPRKNVFGLIFYHRKPERTPTAAASVTFVNGDSLLLRQVSSDGKTFNLTTVNGGKFAVPVSQVKELDLSFGKLKWLSDITPRDIKHEFLIIDVGSKYEVNEDLDGKPLQIGNVQFERGVCIHSKSEVRYRLDGDYTRFQCWVGIQKKWGGDVQLVIKADGKTLHDSIVKPNVKPVRIDLEVSGKYSLEVLVDYGSIRSDVGDLLVLGDAVLLK